MSFWNPERDSVLVEMRKAGRSSSEIGTVLGCSRNAVIGRAKRLRMPRLVTRAPTIKDRVARRQRANAPFPPEAEPEPETSAVAFLDLAPHQCRFPLWPHQRHNEPMPSPLLFCGAPTTGSFCPHHARICYTKGGLAWIGRRDRKSRVFP